MRIGRVCPVVGPCAYIGFRGVTSLGSVVRGTSVPRLLVAIAIVTGHIVELIVVRFPLVERIGRGRFRTQRDRRRATVHSERRGAIRLALELLPCPGAIAAIAALLNDVCELVRDQPVTIRRARLISADAEVDLAILGHGLGRAGSRGAIRNNRGPRRSTPHNRLMRRPAETSIVVG
jgi:hypothetical protein